MTTLAAVFAEKTIGTYACSHDKSQWVDKSLPTVGLIEHIVAVYPNARFICLYRNALDTINSIIEASEFGYDSFGVGTYVARNPRNTVMALALSWIDKTEMILRFEHAHRDRSHRIRYEDLVANPAFETDALYEFWLNAYWSRGHLPEHQEQSSTHTVFGDYKVWSSRRVSYIVDRQR